MRPAGVAVVESGGRGRASLAVLCAKLFREMATDQPVEVGTI